MLEKLVKAVAKISPWKVNPRVIEFGCHYLSGKQTEMTLFEDEIQVTKSQILGSLSSESCKPGEAHIAQLHNYHNDDEDEVDNVMKGWFTHPTMGLVGGFNYTLRLEQDGVYADCVDTWDFNYSSAVLKLSLNKTLLPLVESLLKRLSVPYEVEGTDILIQECWLEHLNEGRAFQTKWSVKLATLEEASNLTVRFATSRSRRRRKVEEYSLLEYVNLV